MMLFYFYFSRLVRFVALGIPIVGEVEEKEELKNLLKWDNVRPRNFHNLKIRNS